MALAVRGLNNSTQVPHVSSYALMVSKWLFFRICGPNLNRTQGMGSIVKDKKPNKLVAHAIPNLSYTGIAH